MWRRVLAVLLLAAVAQLPATPSGAHSDLVSAVPAQGAVVDTAVATVELTFAADVRAGLSHVVVRSRGGADHVVGDPVVLGPRLVAHVTGLSEAGAYEVGYRAVAADGHPVSGSYRFTVSRLGAHAAGRPTATPGAGEVGPAPDRAVRQVAAPARTEGPAVPGSHGPWTAGVLLALAAVLVASFARRSRSTSAARCGEASGE